LRVGGKEAQNAAMPPARQKLLSVLLCLCIASLAPASHAQQSGQTLPKEALAAIQQQVGMDDNLPGEKNPSGLRFRFSKINEEAFVLSGAQGHYVRFRAYVAGARENQKYMLATWKIGAEIEVVYDQAYVNRKGLLMAHKPRPDQEDKDSVESDDELDLAIQAAKGEPVRLLLATADGKFMVPGTIVPYPIESKDGNCRLEARLALPDAEAVLIYADGLPPNTEVPLQSVSAGESEPGKLTVNAQGHAVTIDLPYVEGKDSGVLKASIATKGCSVSVEIPWGKGSYHPL
jgi:hypothetical protein